MPDQPMGPWGRGPGPRAQGGPRTWKMLLNKRKKEEVGREKKGKKGKGRKRRGKREREGERNCFQDKEIDRKIPMLVNGEVLRAHGGPAPLTWLRAPQVLDPAQVLLDANFDDEVGLSLYKAPILIRLKILRRLRFLSRPQRLLS